MVVSTTAGSPRADLAGKQVLFAVLGLIAAGVFLASTTGSSSSTRPASTASHSSSFSGSRSSASESRVRSRGSSSAAGFQIQPSEFARLSIALLLAWILENDDRPILKTRTLVPVAAAVGVPVLLVLAQPDLGVALTYLPFVVAALFFGGLRGRWWATLIVAGDPRDRRARGSS